MIASQFAQTVKKTGVSETTVRRIEKSADFWEYKDIARSDAGYPVIKYKFMPIDAVVLLLVIIIVYFLGTWIYGKIR